ncbi:hypothetical protein J1N35_033768, partial [Gossypium stocksii]
LVVAVAWRDAKTMVSCHLQFADAVRKALFLIEAATDSNSLSPRFRNFHVTFWLGV